MRSAEMDFALRDINVCVVTAGAEGVVIVIVVVVRAVDFAVDEFGKVVLVPIVDALAWCGVAEWRSPT